ncbi:MAG: saccharopine dehydrogenase, partial [Pseudomonadota bacterium]
TTVGPYQLYGSDLVEQCAKLGKDYVDLCGEPTWMRAMIDAHQEAASNSGARIVFSCGFDSVPTDLGILMLQDIAIDRFGSPCAEVKGRVRGLKGTFSGGTAASLQATLKAAKSDPNIMALAINPYSLVPGVEGVKQPNGDVVQFSEEFNTWEAPFVMAAINTRNAHRSNSLMDNRYGESFIYSEMTWTGPGDKGEQIAKMVASDRSLAGPDAPKPGEGPTKEERDTGFYDMVYYGYHDSGSRLAVSVKDSKDPGYGSTCKLISESALCLLNESKQTPGGIWTSASAMGHDLINRLKNNAGLSFEEESA